jgi:hypothetical protein
MHSSNAPLAPARPPAPIAASPDSQKFALRLKQVVGKWPLHRTALLTATPGFAIIARNDGKWLIAPCGPHIDPTEIDGRLERYMIGHFIVVTAVPELTINQADAARRIVHRTLTCPAAMPVLGPCPDGAAVPMPDYIALRSLVGAALEHLHAVGVLDTPAAADQLETGDIVGPDVAAVAALADYNALAATVRVLTSPLRVHAVEVIGGYVLLKGSCVDLTADQDPARSSTLLEHIHGGLLEAQQDGTCRLNHPLAFSSLEGMAHYCLGSLEASTARWDWLADDWPR